jgi:hypothetical protein
MSTEDLNQEQSNDLQMPTEMDLLKQRATLMGIAFSNNIGEETLRQRIADKQAELDAAASGEQNNQEEEEEQPGQKEVNALESATASTQEATNERPLTLREKIRLEQLRLVRVRITCLDPKKKDLPGEILTVANEYLGTVRKFIPFGEVTDDGYHIPYCLYKMLDARKFLNIRTFKDRRTGTVRVESGYVKEFALEILDPLTPAELAKLANAQKAAGSVE